MLDKPNIQFYYFGAMLHGFDQYPYKSIFDRHDGGNRKGNWYFTVSHQQGVCYYEYTYQDIQTKLEGGRRGGHFGIAIELEGYYISDPLQALKALEAMFKLLLKQERLIATNNKKIIGFVAHSMNEQKHYLEKQSTIFSNYLWGEYKDYFQAIPPNIPSPDLKANHPSSFLPYDKNGQEKINTLWKRYGIVTVLAPNSDSVTTPVQKKNNYTLDQIKKMAQNVKKKTEQESEEKIKTIIENINSNTTLNNEEKLQEVLTFFNLPINKIDDPVFEETTALDQDWASHILSPSKPASVPFFKKHRRLIFAACFIGLIACLTPVIWNCLSPENPDPQITENNDKNNTPSGNENNTPNGSGNKTAKVEQSPKCKNRHDLLTIGCVKGKARYFLKSKAFLKKHQGIKIKSPEQFLDLLWSDIEGISIVMEVYDNDVDKMKKVITTVLNKKSFPSINNFIKDQITEQIKKDSTNTITISTSSNTIAAMQGKANEAGKIGTQKGGEMLLYKEQ